MAGLLACADDGGPRDGPRDAGLLAYLRRRGGPSASHYLKVRADGIFGGKRFLNEIAWKRFSGKNDPNRFGRSHDLILVYTKSGTYTWNVQHGPFEPDYVDDNYRYTEEGTGRRYRLSDLTANKPGGDTDYEWHGAKPYKGRGDIVLDPRGHVRRSTVSVVQRASSGRPASRASCSADSSAMRTRPHLARGCNRITSAVGRQRSGRGSGRSALFSD